MEKINKDYSQRRRMDNYSRLIAPLLLTMFALTASSCSAIVEIFKAGMGFGIFFAIAVLVVIVFIIMRFRKK